MRAALCCGFFLRSLRVISPVQHFAGTWVYVSVCLRARTFNAAATFSSLHEAAAVFLFSRIPHAAEENGSGALNVFNVWRGVLLGEKMLDLPGTKTLHLAVSGVTENLLRRHPQRRTIYSLSNEIFILSCPVQKSPWALELRGRRECACELLETVHYEWVYNFSEENELILQPLGMVNETPGRF